MVDHKETVSNEDGPFRVLRSPLYNPYGAHTYVADAATFEEAKKIAMGYASDHDANMTICRLQGNGPVCWKHTKP